MFLRNVLPATLALHADLVHGVFVNCCFTRDDKAKSTLTPVPAQKNQISEAQLLTQKRSWEEMLVLLRQSVDAHLPEVTRMMEEKGQESKFTADQVLKDLDKITEILTDEISEFGSRDEGQDLLTPKLSLDLGTKLPYAWFYPHWALHEIFDTRRIGGNWRAPPVFPVILSALAGGLRFGNQTLMANFDRKFEPSDLEHSWIQIKFTGKKLEIEYDGVSVGQRRIKRVSSSFCLTTNNVNIRPIRFCRNIIEFVTPEWSVNGPREREWVLNLYLKSDAEAATTVLDDQVHY